MDTYPERTTPMDHQPNSPDTTTHRLLTCGVVAGPAFVAVAAAQVMTRDGFDPARHPLSLLSLGDAGWIQIANFVVAGVLFVAAAAGLRRVLHGGKAHAWGPRLLGTFGVSLVAGGVFVADPAFGFPLGTPDGAPTTLTWHGIVHGVAPLIGFLALIVATFVVARRFAADGRTGWAAYSGVTGVVVGVLSALPNIGGDPAGNFGPLWVAMVLAFGWASAAIAQLADRARVPARDFQPQAA